jgi:ribosomal protein L37AE/L43A
MFVLTMNSTTLCDRLVPEKSQTSSTIKLAQSMSSRHTCLSCSNPLLRHIDSGKLYWRCSHCYQAMPVIEDAKEMPLLVTHEKLFQPLLISILQQEQRNSKQRSRKQTAPNLVITPIMIHSG